MEAHVHVPSADPVIATGDEGGTWPIEERRKKKDRRNHRMKI